jgi:predicted  nucleic acid-binding Zn-ribbon protein
MSLSSALKELHHVHRQLAELRARLARGPKQIQAAEAGLKKFEGDVTKAKESQKQAKLACDELQLQLKQREAKLLDVRSKMHQAESNQVYQLLKEQIAADEKANSVLADEILEALEKLDEHQRAIADANANVVKGKDELEKTKQRVAEQSQALEVEMSGWLDKLRVAEDKLPEDFRVEYARMAKAKGEDCLAPVENGTCEGCFQMLTPQTMNELFLGKPLFCKSCGRLLYIVEE